MKVRFLQTPRHDGRRDSHMHSSGSTSDSRRAAPREYQTALRRSTFAIRHACGEQKIQMYAMLSGDIAWICVRVALLRPRVSRIPSWILPRPRDGYVHGDDLHDTQLPVSSKLSVEHHTARLAVQDLPHFTTNIAPTLAAFVYNNGPAGLELTHSRR